MPANLVDPSFDRPPQAEQVLAVPSANPVKMHSLDHFVIGEPVGGFASDQVDLPPLCRQPFVDLVGQSQGAADFIREAVVL